MLKWFYWTGWLPENVSTCGQQIDSLYETIYSITAVTFVLVAAGSGDGRGERT